MTYSTILEYHFRVPFHTLGYFLLKFERFIAVNYHH